MLVPLLTSEDATPREKKICLGMVVKPCPELGLGLGRSKLPPKETADWISVLVFVSKMLNQGHPRQKSTDYYLLRFDSSCDKSTPKKYSHRVCFSKKEGRKAPIPLFFPPNTWKAQFLTNDFLKGCFHLMSVDLNTSVPNSNFRILPSPHPSQKTAPVCAALAV